MSRLPRLTARQLIQRLGSLGYTVTRTSGGHAHLTHPTRPGRITVPMHPGKIIGPGLLRAILRQARLRSHELD
ncbi:MAG: addiction module toxin, HicA family [Deltaproteobacteria bacterium]|nr:MAG: addiction module toxin, HicA family [Deltaproteobacteria bacterium]